MAGRQINQRITADIVPLPLDLCDDGEEEQKDMFQVPLLKRNLLGDFGRPSILDPPVSDHMKVYLRIRPFTDDEINKGENQKCLTVDTNQIVNTHAPKESHYYKNTVRGFGKTTTKYSFSHIFTDDTTQKDFFNQTMLNLVKDFIDGQNCLVFSYGVTNSGKTYTIQGNPKEGGVLPRALDVLFNSINGRQWDGMNLKPDLFMNVTRLSADQELMERKVKEKVMKLGCDDDLDMMSLLGDDASDISVATNTTTCSESSNISTMDGKDSLDNGEKLLVEINNRVREEAKVSVDEQGQIKFSVWVSFAEIYNEQIYDLLEPISKKKNAKRPCLKLSEDQHGSPYIKGLKYVHVNSADEAYKLMMIGQRNLKTACTKLNHCSSRSHCIFNIKILRVVDKDDPHVARVSMLTLCDLAGSERYSKTQASGDRLKEAGNINTSLLTLGRCIETLRHNQAHKEHTRIVPFRESKLTRLFQNFFIGRGKAIMFVNVNQCASMFDETQHVFKFSAIASQVVVQQKPVFIKPKLPVPPSPNPIPRASISWATPAKNKMAEQKQIENIPLPDISDDDIEEEEEENVYTQENIDELLGVIEELQKDLDAGLKNKAKMESEIRKEVCKEMMKQFTEIEEQCSERIRMREQMAEEFAEKRIQIVMDAERGRKRKRDVITDEDDEWVSSVLLHQEKVKVEERDKTISTMKEELGQLEEKVTQLTDGNDKLQKENKNLNQQLADAQKQQKEMQEKLADKESKKDNKCQSEMEELQKKVAEYEEKISSLDKELTKTSVQQTEDSNRADLVENLAQQLQQSREQIKEQEKEVSELNDMLTEAGETFEQKQVEIAKLQELTQEYEKKLEAQGEALAVLEKAASDSKVAIETADQSLTKREECVSGLQAQIRDLEGDVNKYRNKARYFEKHLVEKEEEASTLKHKLMTTQSEHAQSQEALIHGFTAEIGNYKSQLFQLRAQLCGVKSPTKSPGGTLRSPGGSMKSPLAKMELFPMSPLSAEKKLNHSLHAKSPAKQENKEQINDGVNRQIRALQAELDKNCAVVAKLEHTLQMSKASVEDLERRLEGETNKYTQARNKVEELENKMKVVENDTESVEEKAKCDSKLLVEKEKELEQAQEKIKELEPLMTDYFSKSKQLTESERRGKDLQKSVDEKVERIKELEAELSTLKTKVSKTEEEISILEERREELEVVNKELKDMVNKTTTDLETKEIELKVLSPKLNKQHVNIKNSMSVQTEDNSHDSPVVIEKNKEIETLHTKVSKLKAGLKAKDLFFCEASEKCKELEFRIDEKEIESQDLQTQLEKRTLKIEDLQVTLGDKTGLLASTGEELAIVSLDVEKLKRKVAQLTAENTMLKESIPPANTEKESQEKSNSEEVDKLKELVKKSKLDAAELESKVALLEKNNTELVTATETSTKEEVAKLEKQLNERNEKIEKMEKDKENMEIQLRQQKESMSEIATLKQTLIEKNEEIEMYTQNLESVLEEREKEELKQSNTAKQIKDAESKLMEKEVLINNLKENLESANRMKGNLQTESEKLKDKIHQQENLINELESKVNQLSNYSKKSDDLENSVHDLESAVADTAVELSEKDRLIEEKDSEIMNLKSQLEQLKKNAEENGLSKSESKKTNESFSVETKEIDEKLNTLVTDRENLLQKNEELEKCVKTLKEELVWKTSEVESQEAELKNVREQLKISFERSASLEREAKNSEMKSNEMQASDKTSETVDDRLGDALIQIAQLKSSEHTQKALHHKVKGELQETLLELENSRSELKILKDKLTQIEELETQLQAKTSELEKAESMICEFRQKETMNKTVDEDNNVEIKKKNAEIQKLEHHMEKLEKQLKNSNEKVSLHDRINADLREEYERRLERKDRELQQRNETMENIECKIKEYQHDNDEIKQTLQVVQREIETKTTDLYSKVTKIAELEKELQDSNDTIEELEGELEVKTKDLADLQKNIKNMKVSDDKSDERLNALNEVAQLKSSEHTLKAANHKVKGELQEALLDIENCRGDIERLKEKVGKADDIEKALLTKSSELAAAEENISELKTKIEKLEKENSQKETSTCDPLLQKKLNTVVSKLNETEIKNRTLIKEVTQLQSLSERLQEELEEARNLDAPTEREIHRRSRASIIQADPRQSISSPSTKVELVRSKEREQKLSEQLKNANNTIQEWLGKFSETENKLQQKTQELSHARETIDHLQTQQTEIGRTTDKELQVYMNQNNELKLQVLQKDGDLDAKARIIEDLERQLHTELRDLKNVEKDKHEKDEMIALLKETLNDQENILQQQEELLNSKDAEIQACDTEYKELQQKYQGLLETKNTQHQERQAEKTMTRVEVERDRLKEQLCEAEKKLGCVEKDHKTMVACQGDLEQKLCKVMQEKDKLARIVKENNQELKEMEKSLTESRRECEELMSQGADKCAESRLGEARREWDKTVHDLNTKIKNLQCQNKELRFNVSTLEKKLESVEGDKHDKEAKLQEFREERDRLVSGLEAVLKKKDNELKQHKDLIKQLKEKEIEITRSWHEERQKIMVSGSQELNEHFTVKTEAPDEIVDPTPPSKEDGTSEIEPERTHKSPVRSNSRGKPPRPVPPKVSIESPDGETTEIQTLAKSPGSARRRANSSAEKKNTDSAAKRTSRRGRKRASPPMNQDECLPPLPKRRSRDSAAETSVLSEASTDYSSHLQIDATPPVAAKTLRRTRKKNGSQLDLSKNEEETQNKRPSRSAKRSAKHRLLESFRESPMGKTSKKILDNIAEAFSPRSPSKSPSKSPRKSESKENIPAAALEPPEKKRGAGRGKRHKLYSEDYISEPIENTGGFVQSPDDIHQTVTRSLRRTRRN